jgi:hypothetical protein
MQLTTEAGCKLRTRQLPRRCRPLFLPRSFTSFALPFARRLAQVRHTMAMEIRRGRQEAAFPDITGYYTGEVLCTSDSDFSAFIFPNATLYDIAFAFPRLGLLYFSLLIELPRGQRTTKLRSFFIGFARYAEYEICCGIILGASPIQLIFIHAHLYAYAPTHMHTRVPDVLM